MGEITCSVKKPRRILCIGDPVLDVVAHCSTQVLEKLGFAHGGCDIIDENELDRVLEEYKDDFGALTRIPGGSAANVAKCLAKLYAPYGDGEAMVCFTGTIGYDESGTSYRMAMEEDGVDMKYAIVHPTKQNGSCLCLVTPDCQRTMRTCLRASQEHRLSTNQIRKIQPAWTHFEGYYVHKSDCILETMKHLKEMGSGISFDFASFDVVKMYFDLFCSILDARVLDVLFCNEQEAIQFSDMLRLKRDGEDLEYVTKFISYMVETYGLTMVVSRGADGCIAGTRGNIGTTTFAQSPANKVQVIDTIGAGDHFSAGFLYALMHDASLECACHCACLAGGAAVQVQGAHLSHKQIEILKHDIDSNIYS